MTKTLKQALSELDEMVAVYERDYDEWDEKYYQNGLEDVGDFLKDVEGNYEYIGGMEVAEDPAGEVYLNMISYVDDNGDAKLWFWVRDTH